MSASTVTSFSVPPLRLTEVLSRVRVDFARLVSDAEREAFGDAARRCRRCPKASTCEEWIRATAEGEGAPAPEFCELKTWLATLDPRR